MIHPVDQVPDVMEKGGDLRHLHRALGVSQSLQDIRRVAGHHPHVCKAVLRESQRGQRLVRTLDIGSDGRIVLDLFKGQHSGAPFSHSQFLSG